ncbi:M23 family metallopeptidase [Azohydromonas caseinilytica]|uniref:M23 family metallopeptidase n=1 Tax=Azohydromonas caseinilytica TaxID=2728836 RepID=A0A848FHF5_9BURK|nr:M23 family metallopeptidase [Azohydromonas caseinilytica]NML18576.1 M23 family metallopeptidase [Azohydromonas caseinilytica]
MRPGGKAFIARAARSALMGLLLGAGLGLAVVLLPVGSPAGPRMAEAATPEEAEAAAQAQDLAALAERRLLLPVQGVAASELRDTFNEGRDAGARPHEALDIAAPRGTPVVAVDEGRLVKLFTSVPGGLTIYQFDPSSRYAYYYAHLDRYAEGLSEGMTLQRGQVIGYVGSTGNANPEAPHLHFAIFRLDPERQWWKGTAVNPYPVLVKAGRGP